MFVTGNSRTLLFVSNKCRARTINLIGIKIKFIILNKNRWKILLHVGYEFIYTRTTSIPINNGSLSINISRFYEFHPIEINYQFVSVFVPFFLFTNSISRIQNHIQLVQFFLENLSHVKLEGEEEEDEKSQRSS